MKKVFSIICALSLAMSTMLAPSVAHAEVEVLKDVAFVEDNKPRIVTECTKFVSTSGLATIDFYLDFEKYDFFDVETTSQEYIEDEDAYLEYSSGKGISTIQIAIPTSQFTGFATSSCVTHNSDLSYLGLNTDAAKAEEIVGDNIDWWFNASNMDGIFAPEGKTKLFTLKAKLDTSLYTSMEDVNNKFDIAFSDQEDETSVVIWTLENQSSQKAKTEKIYKLTSIGKVSGTPDNAVVTLGDAVGTVATKDANTGKVWNNVKVEEVSKATSYKAVFTDKATGEKAEFAINGLTGDEVNGDATFAVILKLVEKVANSADILLDIVCE